LFFSKNETLGFTAIKEESSSQRMGVGRSTVISGYGFTKEIALASLDARLFYEHGGARLHHNRAKQTFYAIRDSKRYYVQLHELEDDNGKQCYRAFIGL
jgi:hypothetical protein